MNSADGLGILPAMFVSAQLACRAAHAVCPLLDRRCWMTNAVRAGIARDLSQASWPEIMRGFHMRSHSTLQYGYRNWVGLDWPTRFGWLKLADEALFDLRMSIRHNAARQCSASVETGRNQGGSAEPASASPRAKPTLASDPGVGWRSSGLCAIPIGRSPQHKPKGSTTAQFGNCANTSLETRQRAAS